MATALPDPNLGLSDYSEELLRDFHPLPQAPPAEVTEALGKRKSEVALSTPSPKQTSQRPRLDVPETSPQLKISRLIVQEHNSAKKLAQLNKVSRSPFKMADRGLQERDRSVRAFRDYQEYAPARDALKNHKCASDSATIDFLTDLSKLNIGKTKPTYGMLLQRHLHEEEVFTTIRNVTATAVEAAIDKSYNEKAALDPTELVTDIRGKTLESLTSNFRDNRAKFQSQEPTNYVTVMDTKAEVFANRLSLKILAVAKEIPQLCFNPDNKEMRDKTKTDAKRDIIKYSKPYLLEVSEVVRSTLTTDEDAPSKGEVAEYCNRAVRSEEAQATELATAQVAVTQLQVQVGALTSAVAETAHSESDKKLRLRNLDKILITPLDTGGDFHKKRASRDARETEIKTWINGLINAEPHFKPNYSIFIVEPKSSSRQRATAILTVTLESDKFRFEQMISKARKGDLSQPSSQRYSGPDHPALNLPDYKDLSSKILSHYSTKLSEQVRNVDEGKRTELLAKWEADPNDTLFITRKTAKNPFKIFYEFQDPSNNMTFMRYIPGLNPFDFFDFTQAIPNPGTREKAKVDEAYRKRYKPYKSRQ